MLKIHNKIKNLKSESNPEDPSSNNIFRLKYESNRKNSAAEATQAKPLTSLPLPFNQLGHDEIFHFAAEINKL